MAMLLQPAVRTGQPRGAAPLDLRWASRIYACVDAGNLVSYRNGSVGVPYVSLTTPARASGYWTRTVDARGNLASIVSYDQLSTHPPRQAVTVTELTLFATGFIGAASGDTFQVMAAMMDLNGPTYVAYIAFDRTSGKLISGLFKGGAWTVIDSGITFEYGKTYRCSLTAKSGYAEMYVDGIRVATDTSAGWVSYTTFRDLCVGNSEYNYFRLNGGVLVAGATRAFSPTDAKALSANPWQIFRDTEVPTFTVGGGATSGVGASAGTGAASATAQAMWATVGASAAVGAAAAVGSTAVATVSGDGASAGAGSAAAISQATWVSAAAATASGSAAAISQATWVSAAAATASGSAAATSQATWVSVGASAGAGASSATSLTVVASIGASAGTGAAAATGDDAGSAFSPAIATSSGTGAAAATSRATWATVAASSAVSSVAATANAVWAGVASSAGAATASADGVTDSAVQAAVGSATGSATGSAVARVVAAVAGAAAGAAVASGVSDALSAVVEAAGAAVAVAVASAAAHAIWNAVGSSAGSTTASGASPTVLDAVAVAQQIVVRTAEAIVVVTSRGLASKVVTDG